MARNLGKVAAARPAGYTVLGADADFRARDCVCRHGVASPVVFGQFGVTQISVVLGGSFQFRTSAGHGVVGPGSLLLGNVGAAYEFRHVVDGGDRSIVFDYADTLLEGRFGAVALPAAAASAGAVAVTEAALASGDAEMLREAALAVLGIAGGAGPAAAGSPSHAQARRVARALRYIEAHSAEDCSLEILAATAGLGRHHFLRIFRALTGQTPRQHVIATRLRHAALALLTSRRPVTEIAYAAGFGDLSHFTTTFTLAFRCSPRTYRKRAGQRAQLGDDDCGGG